MVRLLLASREVLQSTMQLITKLFYWSGNLIKPFIWKIWNVIIKVLEKANCDVWIIIGNADIVNNLCYKTIVYKLRFCRASD